VRSSAGVTVTPLQQILHVGAKHPLRFDLFGADLPVEKSDGAVGGCAFQQ
jgi:hypothetical protein